MAGTVDIAKFRDGLIFLTTAAVFVPALQRLRINPILGFLLVGALLGPFGLGQLDRLIPALEWVTITDRRGLGLVGDLGVAFLLFVIGLEVSLPRLLTMRRLVFGLGSLQVLVSALVLSIGLSLLGMKPAAAILFGLALSLSSTAIVVEVLSSGRRLTSATGRMCFSILLLQDLAVLPLLFMVAAFEPANQGHIVQGLLWSFGKGALAIGLIVMLGTLLLKPLFRLVAATANVEIFVAAVLLVVVASGLATEAAGMSMALGAFAAGLLLAETEYRKAVEATIEPFKGLLLGVFFFSVGLGIDVAGFMANPLPKLGAITLLFIAKGVVMFALARLFGATLPTATEASFLLAPGGEFAIIVIGLAATAKIVAPDIAAFALGVTGLSMAMIPVLDVIGRNVARLLAPVQPPDPALLASPSSDSPVQAIVIGHGRVGDVVSDMLTRHGVSHLVIDQDPAVVAAHRKRGQPTYFGDARNTEFLRRCGIPGASAVILTIHGQTAIDEQVRAIRALDSDIIIVARARDAGHASHLYHLGVTDAVPETIEASLQLSEAALVGLGVPTGPVIASVHEKRDEFRAALQKAAGREILGVRATTRETSAQRDPTPAS